MRDYDLLYGFGTLVSVVAIFGFFFGIDFVKNSLCIIIGQVMCIHALSIKANRKGEKE